MPSRSKAQHSLMEAVAHSPAFAAKTGIPQKVGKDYAAADKSVNVKALPKKAPKAKKAAKKRSK